MNSKVIRLADLDQYQIDAGYRNISVEEDEIGAILENMASNLGRTVEIDALEENCGVVCTASDGSNVLLYPSLQIDGAVQAAQDVADKSAGDTFTTVIRDREMTLTVEKILKNCPLEMNDQLALAADIEGVETLEQLREYLQAQEMEKRREQNVRMLYSEYMQYLIEESEVEIDESEADSWAEAEAKRVYEEELSFGIDLRFTEEGDMLSLEEALDRLALELKLQFKANLIQEYYGKETGFVPSEEEGITYDSYMYDVLTARAREELS